MSILDPFVDLIEDGADWLADVVEGPLRDFALTPLGKVVLRAAATYLTAALGPIVGPQLAAIAFALPGMARGEPFAKAWVEEFSWRLKTLAEIYGAEASRAAADQVKIATDWLKQEAANRFPGVPLEEAVRRLNLDVRDVARHLGVKEEMAARAIALVQQVPFRSSNRYDLATGNRTPLTSVREALSLSGTAGSLRATAIPYAGGSVMRWMRAVP